MHITPRTKKSVPRSRSGCHECRQLHRKCDERRPSCGLCQTRGRDCTYGLRISWGGRKFPKSTFGQCMTSSNGHSASVIQVRLEHLNSSDESQTNTPFVYGVNKTGPAPFVPTSSAEMLLGKQRGRELPHFRKEINVGNGGREGSVKRFLTLLPQLSATDKILFNYFFHVADSFCCDERIKNTFCTAFLPIAVEDSQLMASILSLCAIHRANLGLAQCPEQLAVLQVIAVKKLRSNLSGVPTEASMASVLMLCYSELIHGREKGYSWRSHLEGAASLFDQQSSTWSVDSPNSTASFIARCFVSLAALANVSGSPPSKTVTKQARRMMGRNIPAPGIDDFTAYSSDLAYILFNIGDLVTEKLYLSTHESMNGAIQLEVRSLELIHRLNFMAQKYQQRQENITFHDVQPKPKQEYLSINEAYHLAAALQIHKQIRGMSSAAREIQHLVHRILDLLSDIKLHSGPCIAVVLFFPVFSAGCGAVDSIDRQRVRDLLNVMIKSLGFVNIKQGLDLLETLWSQQDQYGETETNNSWVDFINANVDFLLY
ncbi:fungal-specific transcription factor domain-containing protein [Dactylonectria macrodidyma]|uniref:Fungal-specific transcription factor domain-containing protein n=1 Tax=Dactylonectria macrodidyma TaxID=307937 RepID=A0A9P9E1P5_9HYPO|nr:fungal-specific transcription factor domain-containing protein [Dactylonectria macrodidyma]